MSDFCIICKKKIIETMLKELNIPNHSIAFNDSPNLSTNNTYELVKTNLDNIIRKHQTHLKSKLPLIHIMDGLPFIVWTSKMHKNTYLATFHIHLFKLHH